MYDVNTEYAQRCYLVSRLWSHHYLQALSTAHNEGQCLPVTQRTCVYEIISKLDEIKAWNRKCEYQCLSSMWRTCFPKSQRNKWTECMQDNNHIYIHKRNIILSVSDIPQSNNVGENIPQNQTKHPSILWKQLSCQICTGHKNVLW